MIEMREAIRYSLQVVLNNLKTKNDDKLKIDIKHVWWGKPKILILQKVNSLS